MPRPGHVLIIGGGLAGPCLALSLARHNIKSTIFELRAERNESGGSISLGPNGLQVLDKYAGVYDILKSQGFLYQRFGAYVETGEKLGEIAAGEEDGYPALRIMRSQLNKVLLDAAEKNGVIIKYGAVFSDIVEDDNGVKCRFVDGSEATGDILIGADGIHSAARKHVLGDSAPKPSYTGICLVNGFLPSTSAVLPSPSFNFPMFTFTSSGFLMTIPIDPEAKTLAWGINMTTQDRSREEWAEFEASGEAARHAIAYYDDIQTQPVRSLLDSVKDSRIWPTYHLARVTRWHTSRVCLVGDAAHGLPPNGQGSALAFEDVAILTRLLTSDSQLTYEQLFAKFQTVREPRVESLREKTKNMETMKRQSGGLIWYMKKWAFRGYFWWNSGVVYYNGKKRYDVDHVDLGTE